MTEIPTYGHPDWDSRGTCRGCGRTIQVRIDGRIRFHYPATMPADQAAGGLGYCLGSGESPAPRNEDSTPLAGRLTRVAPLTQHGDTTGPLCEQTHHCPTCTLNLCLMGEACTDLHTGACCGSLVACDCEPCGGRPGVPSTHDNLHDPPRP